MTETRTPNRAPRPARGSPSAHSTPHRVHGWGEEEHRQARLAAHLAHTHWGIPHAARSAIAELPAGGCHM